MRIYSYLFLLSIAFFTSGCGTKACDNECEERVYVHKYGVRVRPDYWVDKGQSGQVISTMRDGVIITQSYCAGELHGECNYTYPNSGKVHRSEIYNRNVLEKENTYYPSGAPEKTCEWLSPNSYTVTTWYEWGSPHSVEKFEDGRLLCGEYFTGINERDSWVYDGAGERITRDCKGNFICMDEFNGGELYRRTYYYPNKGPREVISFMNGVPHGERKTYYSDGSPCTTESWEHGRQNGTMVIFQNGEKYSEVPYFDGKKNGIERRYADGYNLSQEVTWYNNQMHGPTYTYVGDCIQTDWFYKGRMTSQSNFESYYAPRG